MTTILKTTARALGTLALSAALISGAAAAELPDAAKDAILKALDDEYHAEAFYEAVMDKFGAVRPFVNIARSERQHQAWLIQLMDTYDIEVPANPYLSGEKELEAVPATLAGACAIGVEAEIANRALYEEELLPVVTEYGDITTTFEALSDASQYRHLPAFTTCAN